jgi:hypothetical protein
MLMMERFEVYRLDGDGADLTGSEISPRKA